ncbi:interferon-induced protein 44-like [Dreissena polymorpha]|uniref:interferon-induced protein 44-like n=1 Tax=Dreissena polymorpha TaxID=45954 RepID=UPI0022644DEE|nr:interferon-induced protein 44-like [Dreissena polymorpha]
MSYKEMETKNSATAFHQKCDNKGPTVTVLYNQQDSVYEEYASSNWTSSTGAYITDSNAFLYQLKYSGSDTLTKFSYLETLIKDIVSFKHSGKLGLSDVRILMLGPVGTGKSSFYNTINSVFKGRISQSAPCGVAINGITIAYTPYEVNVSSGESLKFRLCDTRGLEVTQSLDIFECNYLLDGNIPDYFQFNPVAPIIPDNPLFVHQPKCTEKIHCVLFVIDAATIGDIPQKMVDKMQNFQKLINLKGIPKAVLLAKVDLACQDVASNINNVFTSKKIEAAVDKASNVLGLPRNRILPVKNYENEMELDDNISILALLSLRQLLFYAEDYLQVLSIKMKALEKGSDQE